MKKLFKNKKLVISLSIILLFIIVVLGFLMVQNMIKKDDTNGISEESYVAYVKINPLIKLSFNVFYGNCEDKHDCSDYTTEVVNVTSLNDDASSIYQDLDFKGKNLEEVIARLILTAEENDYNIENVTITTNWNYSKDSINQKIQDKLLNTKTPVEIQLKYQKELDEKEIVENEEEKYYTVSFDSDGGMAIESQQVALNAVVERPTDPTKDGYTFIEWQLDGKTYDFNSKVTKDITLKAIWQEIRNSNDNSNTNTNNSQSNSNQQTNEPTTPAPSEPSACTPKKFNNTYSYVYTTPEECQKQGNNAFFEISDNKDSGIFAYGCDTIVDDCGTTWYGVYFNKYSDEQGVYKVYY